MADQVIQRKSTAAAPGQDERRRVGVVGQPGGLLRPPGPMSILAQRLANGDSPRLRQLGKIRDLAASSPQAAELRSLQALVDARAPATQLAKVTTLTPGRLNVIGEHHDESGDRRPKEKKYATDNQLFYILENEAITDEGQGREYGDPPWLRAINVVEMLIPALGAFIAEVNNDPRNLPYPWGPALAKLRSLNGLLNFTFNEREGSWWEQRKEKYKGVFSPYAEMNSVKFESNFRYIEKCRQLTHDLAAVYAYEYRGSGIDVPRPTMGGKMTGEPVEPVMALASLDPAWAQAASKFETNIMFTGMAFSEVSKTRSDGMHAWANKNKDRPVIWKIGDNHIGHIHDKYANKTQYDYMFKTDFDKIMTAFNWVDPLGGLVI